MEGPQKAEEWSDMEDSWVSHPVWLISLGGGGSARWFNYTRPVPRILAQDRPVSGFNVLQDLCPGQTSGPPSFWVLYIFPTVQDLQGLSSWQDSVIRCQGYWFPFQNIPIDKQDRQDRRGRGDG